jgi:putative glutamine amidotransferase
MSDKPFVGVGLECGFNRFTSNGFFDLLLPRWVECINRAGGLPLLVPVESAESDLRQYLRQLSAFVFVGYRDLDPEEKSYSPDGADVHPEVRLIRTIAESHLPFFGIGAGIQLLNVSFGGTLRRTSGVPSGGSGHVYAHNPRHALVTVPGSLVDRVYGDGTSLVNSEHGVAVDEVAVGFSVTARCRDGVVEAIESETEDWLAVGLQFRPEPDAHDPDLRIFEEFLDAVRESSPQLLGK